MAGGRVDALIPEPAPPGSGAGAAEQAQRIARRLGQHGAVGLSAAEPGPGDLSRALREADVVLDLARSGAGDLEALQPGTWRLLTRLAVIAPGEVEHVTATTPAPLLEPGARSRAALLDTLTTYLDTCASMHATAAAGFAHRHTVAYEQLNLGLKARAVCDAVRRAAGDRAL